MGDILFMIAISPMYVFSQRKKHGNGGIILPLKKQMVRKKMLIWYLLLFYLPVKAQYNFPGKVVSSASEGESLGAASITILPDDTYLVSHSWSGNVAKTTLLQSTDKGETWEERTNLTGIKGSTLFLHQNMLYMMGVSANDGNIIIMRSADSGYSWTTPSNAANGLLFTGEYNTNAVPFAIYNGRIWRSYDAVNMGITIISASVTSDLLNASSWEKSNEISFNQSWVNAYNPLWSNGNVLVNKENNLIVLAGVSTIQGQSDSLEFQGGALGIPRHELSAIINVSNNNTELNFDPCTSFIHFPGAHAKSTIRYDQVTGKYWSIVNKITEIYSETNFDYSPIHQRNVLMLVSSPDLIHWTEKAVIVSWNRGERLTSQDRFAFQDVDWQFDGNDIIAVSRTAWYSSTSYKDANYITFHRIKDYGSKEMYPLPEDLAISEIDESMFSESAMLLGWSMNTPDTQGNETELGAKIVDTNIQPSILIRGDGLNPDNFTRSFFSRFKYIGSSVNTKEYALNNNSYFQFTVNAKENVIAALDTLKFKLRSGSNGPYFYRWFYSVNNGFTFKELGTADGNINYAAALPDGIVQQPLVLTGENKLKYVPYGIPVIFRLYVWGATNQNTSTISIGRSDAGTTPSVVLSLIGRTQVQTTLPVNNVISFKGKKALSGVKLIWQTSSAKADTRFEVFHSIDNGKYNLITSVSNGISSTYHYTDQNAVSGINYYKLSQIDISGRAIEYGPVIILFNIRDEFLMSAYSSATNEGISLAIYSPLVEIGRLTISDITGRILFNQALKTEKGYAQLQLTGNFSKGKLYVVSFRSNKIFNSIKFINQ